MQDSVWLFVSLMLAMKLASCIFCKVADMAVDKHFSGGVFLLHGKVSENFLLATNVLQVQYGYKNSYYMV